MKPPIRNPSIICFIEGPYPNPIVIINISAISLYKPI